MIVVPAYVEGYVERSLERFGEDTSSEEDLPRVLGEGGHDGEFLGDP